MFLEKMAAARIANLFIYSLLYFIVTKLPISIHATQQIPCLFIFGDSLNDNGNSKFVLSLGNTNYPPYGIDYPTGPTGRYTNGKTMADFLAEILGFDNPIPPFATATGPEILKGVNYASGGGGILDESDALAVGRATMNGQLINHGLTSSKIALLLRNATLARDHLNKCLYAVNMGNNDYVNNYLLQLSPTHTLYTPTEFAAILIKQYDRQLRTLYKYGARKVAVIGLGLLGNIPQMRYNSANYIYKSMNSTNDVIGIFDTLLKPLIDTLNTNLEGAQFILLNSTNVQGEDSSTLGIKVKDVPCCVTSRLTGLCDTGKMPCSNRDEYYFWDSYHPTEFVYRAYTKRGYAAESPADAYPIDIQNLVRR